MNAAQLELPNLNQLITAANPTPVVKRSNANCSLMPEASRIAHPTTAYVQMEFPFVEQLND